MGLRTSARLERDSFANSLSSRVVNLERLFLPIERVKSAQTHTGPVASVFIGNSLAFGGSRVTETRLWVADANEDRRLAASV